MATDEKWAEYFPLICVANEKLCFTSHYAEFEYLMLQKIYERKLL